MHHEQGLFRQEAVEAQRPQTLGAIRLAVLVSQQVWALVAVLFTGIIVAWLFLGHYTRREHVTGSLVPTKGLLTVASRSIGVVSKLTVKPGEHVVAGQSLLTISGDQSSAALGNTDAVIAQSLRQQQAQIQATLAALPAQETEEASDLRRRIAMTNAQIRQMDSQMTLQRTEARTATTLLAKVQPLVRQGILSTVDYDTYQANALNASEQLKAQQSQRLSADQQRSQLVTQLQELPTTTAATAHQLRAQLAQLAASVAQNEVSRAEVFHAAYAGTVASILVKPGQAVTPGESLLSILPTGSPLEAQLLVPSDAIGFVHDGTRVALHYQAFPYQKFGVHYGTVSEVSRSALTQAEVSELLGQQVPAMSLYRVEVRLATQQVDAYGKHQNLLPGMTLTADLMLDRRRMIDWLFEPLYGLAKRQGGKA